MVKVVLLHGVKKTCDEEKEVHNKEKPNTLQQLHSDSNLLLGKSTHEMSLAYG